MYTVDTVYSTQCINSSMYRVDTGTVQTVPIHQCIEWIHSYCTQFINPSMYTVDTVYSTQCINSSMYKVDTGTAHTVPIHQCIEKILCTVHNVSIHQSTNL